MTTFEKIRELIVEQLGVNPVDVTASALLVDDLGADSIDLVELVMDFEDEFSIYVPDDEGLDMIKKSVGEIVKYIDQNKLFNPA